MGFKIPREAIDGTYTSTKSVHSLVILNGVVQKTNMQRTIIQLRKDTGTFRGVEAGDIATVVNAHHSQRLYVSSFPQVKDPRNVSGSSKRDLLIF